MRVRGSLFTLPRFQLAEFADVGGASITYMVDGEYLQCEIKCRNCICAEDACCDTEFRFLMPASEPHGSTLNLGMCRNRTILMTMIDHRHLDCPLARYVGTRFAAPKSVYAWFTDCTARTWCMERASRRGVQHVNER